MPGFSPHAAGKTAFVAFARVWNAEQAAQRIRVNGLHPDPTDTPALGRLSPAQRNHLVCVYLIRIRPWSEPRSRLARSTPAIAPGLSRVKKSYCPDGTISFGFCWEVASVGQ